MAKYGRNQEFLFKQKQVNDSNSNRKRKKTRKKNNKEIMHKIKK
jgi:hypothetical protein